MNRRVLIDRTVRVGDIFVTIEVVKFSNNLYMGYIKTDETNTIRSTGFCITPADAVCSLLFLLQLELSMRHDYSELVQKFF